MRLPSEKIIFTVDWIPIQGVQYRAMADTYVPDIEEGLKKVIEMDWEPLFPAIRGRGASRPGPKTMRANSLRTCRIFPPR